ncbi:MAG: hypothetical protein WDM76_13940 [Limisphaerales bacterium]
MSFLRASLTVLVLLTMLSVGHASSIILLTTEENVHVSDAVFAGTVTGMSCFKDDRGLIYTRTSLRVDEALKGMFPGDSASRASRRPSRQ